MLRETADRDEAFIVRFSAWEGPIEAMLDLARSQKIDLSRIDMVELVSQFEAVVGKAMALKLELAADWLVMAAWLAYLKSKILLRRPRESAAEELDEDSLAYHLRRLGAVRAAAAALEQRPALGRDWYLPGGADAGNPAGRLARDLAGLLAAYPVPKAAIDAQEADAPDLKPFDLASVDSAISRLSRDLPLSGWSVLLDMVPRSAGLRFRSEVASTLIGTLELARSGVAEIEQSAPDAPIMVRRAVHA